MSDPAPEEATLSRSLLRRSGVSRLVLPLLTVLTLAGQTHWLHFELLGRKNAYDEPGPYYCLLLSLLAALALLPRTLSLLACVLLSLLVTTLFLMDATYYDFFHELPSWHLLPTWRQAGKASQSLSTLWKPDDAVLLAGPILVLLVALAVWRLGRHRPRPGWVLPVLAAALALGASVYCVRNLPDVRWIQFKRRFQNIAMAEIFSPLYYHAYDTYEVTRVALGVEGGARLDESKVKAAVGKSRELSTQKTPFQGMFEGRDLIWVQLESLEYFALEAEVKGKPVMPFLQRMARIGYAFKLFDQTHLGRSADGQFIYMNSLHPPAERPLAFTYPTNHFVAIPRMFSEKGYDTIYMHPSDPSFWNSKLMAGSYGYETLLFRDELPARDADTEIRGWGLTDEALFTRVVERTRTADSKPFFAYVVTMMCHHPYPEIQDEDTDFPPPEAESMVRRYLRCCNLRDRSLENLVRALGKSQRGRRTVLILVGDHDSNVTNSEKIRLRLPSYPQSEAVPFVICTVESALTGKPLLDNDERPPVKFGAQMDVAPSVGHVFSLAMEKSVFLGWNLFAKQNSGSRISRLGTWMDRRGMIKPPEDTSEALDTTEFEVSEMLLQSDKIPDFRRPF